MNYNLHAFVTKDLVEQKKKVGFMYKEKSDNINDSGWRFFSGDEPQEYVDNVDNIMMCSIDDVINNIDSSIEPYLNYPIGSTFERQDNNHDFSEIKDFDFGKDSET